MLKVMDAESIHTYMQSTLFIQLPVKCRIRWRWRVRRLQRVP